MTKADTIKSLIERVYGKVGTEPNQFEYEVWQDHHAVCQVINEGEGTIRLLTESSANKLIDKLETLLSFKRYIETK